MHRLKPIILFALALLFTSQLAAQSSLTPKSGLTASTDLKEITANNFSFFTDDDNKVYYIDFESIPVNLADIVVKNEAGDIILKDNLFDLPVNTIYEVDTSNYAAGTYQIELRSYTGVIRKEIEVK